MIEAAINIPARRAYAELLRQFASGRMTNFEFERRGVALEGKLGRDSAVNEVEAAAWYLYDDFKEHRLNQPDRTMDPLARREIARWVLFLRSYFPAPKTARWPDGVQALLSPIILLGGLVGIGLLVVGFTMAVLISFGFAVGGVVICWAISLAWRIYFKLNPRKQTDLVEAESRSIWPFESIDHLSRASKSCGYLGALLPAHSPLPPHSR